MVYGTLILISDQEGELEPWLNYVEWHFIVRHYKRCYIYVVRCNIIKILHSESKEKMNILEPLF